MTEKARYQSNNIFLKHSNDAPAANTAAFEVQKWFAKKGQKKTSVYIPSFFFKGSTS